MTEDADIILGEDIDEATVVVRGPAQSLQDAQPFR